MGDTLPHIITEHKAEQTTWGLDGALGSCTRRNLVAQWTPGSYPPDAPVIAQEVCEWLILAACFD